MTVILPLLLSSAKFSISRTNFDSDCNVVIDKEAAVLLADKCIQTFQVFLQVNFHWYWVDKCHKNNLLINKDTIVWAPSFGRKNKWFISKWKCNKFITWVFYNNINKKILLSFCKIFLLKLLHKNSCVKFDAFSRRNGLLFFLKKEAFRSENVTSINIVWVILHIKVYYKNLLNHP